MSGRGHRDRDWIKYRDRCWSHMALLVNGFIAYCGIPMDREKVTFLKWNEATGEKRAYSRPEDGKSYTLLGATDFDAEDGYWHLGVCINLNSQAVFFPLRDRPRGKSHGETRRERQSSPDRSE
jgi:hypothetical protein